MAELLEKIPAEKRWAITAKALGKLITLRGSPIIAPLLSKGEGIFAPVIGWERYEEIMGKVMSRAGRRSFPWIKETFNISVEDAIGAAKLVIVASTLLGGPEYKFKIVEETRERVVLRRTHCPWWERYKEHKIDPGRMVCHHGHQAWAEEGLKAINPKITFKLTKSVPRGNPYCEDIIELKDV